MRSLTRSIQQLRSRLRRMPLARLSIALAASLTLAPAASAADPPTELDMDGHQPGRIFEGFGAISSGGTTKLLYDYPEPYRSRILDYLFKPNYGASLQHLKVEIGGDGNSGPGSEASHMHSRDDLDLDRGYEWWLMKEAKERNPDITLSVLEWSVPSWIGDGDYFSQDNIDYILAFLKGAKRRHGLTIDDVGTVNEPSVIHQDVDWDWVKRLKRAMVRNGIKARLVVGDDPVRDCCPTYLPWKALDAMLADPELMDAVDVLGSHYAGSVVPDAAKAIPGLTLWSSEDGPWTAEWNAFVGGSYAPFAVFYNRNYITGRMTATHIWNLVTSYYDNLIVPDSGLMLANTPWSGHFEVQSPIWITAHTTQFAQPGWQYLDGASKLLPDEASVVALKSPNGSDYSAIFETMSSTRPQTVNVRVSGGLSTRTLHVWRTTEHDWFSRQPDIKPVNGAYTITLQPGAVYSVTTTGGQRKGAAASAPARAFPFPYNDDFEQGKRGQQPRYLSQQGGSYELTTCAAGRAGRCVEQVVDRQPVEWLEALPTTFLGDASWQDYSVESKLLFRSTGTAELVGRIGNAGAQNVGISIPRVPDGYYLDLQQNGRWRVTRAANGDKATLVSGHVVLTSGRWHTASISFRGTTITATIDGVRVGSVDDATYTHGMAGIGTGWNRVQFDDFVVTPAS